MIPQNIFPAVLKSWTQEKKLLDETLIIKTYFLSHSFTHTHEKYFFFKKIFLPWFYTSKQLDLSIFFLLNQINK